MKESNGKNEIPKKDSKDNEEKTKDKSKDKTKEKPTEIQLDYNIENGKVYLLFVFYSLHFLRKIVGVLLYIYFIFAPSSVNIYIVSTLVL